MFNNILCYDILHKGICEQKMPKNPFFKMNLELCQIPPYKALTLEIKVIMFLGCLSYKNIFIAEYQIFNSKYFLKEDIVFASYTKVINLFFDFFLYPNNNLFCM